MDIKNSPEFKKTIVFLATKLKGRQYAFRGTASLVLQGIGMKVDDIDVLCDRKTALAVNRLLEKYLKNKVAYKDSDKFKSYFGEFAINGLKVEVMGDWSIKDGKGVWSEPFDASNDEIIEKKVDGEKVKLTRIETELAMYTLMGRWSAFHKIKKQIPLI
jgi:hypothetical protein